MVYINIPYTPENNKIDRDMVIRELQSLVISDSAKQSAYAAIYNLRPRGVNFDYKNSVEALLLEAALKKLGVPYRKSEESEYYIGENNTG